MFEAIGATLSREGITNNFGGKSLKYAYQSHVLNPARYGSGQTMVLNIQIKTEILPHCNTPIVLRKPNIFSFVKIGHIEK